MEVAILVVFVFGMVVSLLARPGSPIAAAVAWITGLLCVLLVNLGVFALDVDGPATTVDFAYWFIANGEHVPELRTFVDVAASVSCAIFVAEKLSSHGCIELIQKWLRGLHPFMVATVLCSSSYVLSFLTAAIPVLVVVIYIARKIHSQEPDRNLLCSIIFVACSAGAALGPYYRSYNQEIEGQTLLNDILCFLFTTLCWLIPFCLHAPCLRKSDLEAGSHHSDSKGFKAS